MSSRTNRTLKDHLTTHEVVKILGVSKRQLKYWDWKGLVSPRRSTPSNERCYDFRDVVQLTIIKGLRSRGVGIKTIRQAVDRLRLQSIFPDTPLINLGVYTDGKVIFVSRNDQIWNAATGQLELFDLQFKELFDSVGQILRKPSNYKKLPLRYLFSRDELESPRVAL